MLQNDGSYVADLDNGYGYWGVARPGRSKAVCQSRVRGSGRQLSVGQGGLIFRDS
jgi:hypothetical protein